MTLFLSGAASDARIAVRRLLQTPLATSVVLATIAIGAAATIAIYAAVHAVLLRPLQVARPDRLVMVWESNDARDWHRVRAAAANALDWRERVHAFQDVALFLDSPSNVALAAGGTSVPVDVAKLSGNGLSLLGAPIALGRGLVFEDTWNDAPPRAVLSNGLWKRIFGADTSIVGRTIQLDRASYEVVGVVGPNFQYPMGPADVFVTFRWSSARRTAQGFRQAHTVRAIARLRDGVDGRTAQAELNHIATRLEREYPATNSGMKAGITPLQESLTGDQRRPLLLMLAAALVLQLVVCANVANLLLVRALGRRGEVAVRRALGAPRQRLFRLFLVESAAIAFLGSAAGLALGAAGIRLLKLKLPAGLATVELGVDWRIASFAVALACITALLCGIQPALMGVRTPDVPSSTPRWSSASRSTMRVAHLLTSAEVALSLVLLCVAGLMLRSVAAARVVESGVQLHGVVTFMAAPPPGSYPTDSSKLQFAEHVVLRLRTIVGVEAVGAARTLPFGGAGWTSDFTIQGWPSDRSGVELHHREATAGYFAALRVPLLEGTFFPDGQTSGVDAPVVVNRAFAARYFPRESPVGRRITFGRVADSTARWHDIVGVTGNERMELSSEPRPEVITHIAADVPSRINFVVRSEHPIPESVLRGAVAVVDPAVIVAGVRPMTGLAVDALAVNRYVLALVTAFACITLGLATMGVYGVSAQIASSRMREIGVRRALGAPDGQAVMSLLRPTLAFAMFGIAVGIPLALSTGRLVRGMVFGIQPTDPTTLFLATALLFLAALAGAYVPARRAVRSRLVSILNA